MNVFFLELSGRVQRYEIDLRGWFKRQPAAMNNSRHFTRAAKVLKRGRDFRVAE
jgi:uncharacterized protein YrrD